MTPETVESGSSIDIISVGIILIVCILLVGTIFFIRRKIQEQEYRNRLEEANFENTILSELGSRSSDMNFVVPPSSDIQLHLTANDSEANRLTADSPPLPLQTPEDPLPSPLSNGSTDFRIEIAAKKVINQLVAANLTDGIFDFITLHGNPQHALSLKLKMDKLVLILPAPESEAFIRQQSKRYDHIIVLDRNGNGLVTTTLENFISDKIRF